MNYYGYANECQTEDIDQQNKWKMQRETQGFDDTELWNLDTTIAKFILPRLIEFKKQMGTPHPISKEDWTIYIDKMIKSFEFLSGEEKYTIYDKEQWEETQEGLGLFAQHFSSLWL